VKHWLFKTEPGCYSIDDLARDGETLWDGVRNYQARNLLRDEVRVGDRVFVYHSNAAPPAIAGLAEVVGAAEPDPTAFDPADEHFDPRSTPDAPVWLGVRIAFRRRFDAPLPLAELRADPALDGLPLLQRGQRLSILPVAPAQAKHLLKRLGVKA